MASTRIGLIVPHTFAKEGNYEVSINGLIANVNIAYFQNNKATDEIMDLISQGKVTLEPDDPEGWQNLSRVIIVLPYLTTSAAADINQSDPTSFSDHYQKLNEEITSESLKYLNRLVEVVRYSTHRYWMRYLSEAQIKIYEI